jgi:hypothetical protein
MQKENLKQNSTAVELKVFYGKGITLSLKRKTFREAMDLVWNGDAFQHHSPIKMMFVTTRKVLYPEESKFRDYLNEDITLEELIETTGCDELYRNQAEISFGKKKNLRSILVNSGS